MLMVGLVLRFWPEYVELRRLVERGELGRPTAVFAQRLSPPADWADWLGDREQSGGTAVDLLIHDFDQMNACSARRARCMRASRSPATCTRSSSTTGPRGSPRGAWRCRARIRSRATSVCSGSGGRGVRVLGGAGRGGGQHRCVVVGARAARLSGGRRHAGRGLSKAPIRGGRRSSTSCRVWRPAGGRSRARASRRGWRCSCRSRRIARSRAGGRSRSEARRRSSARRRRARRGRRRDRGRGDRRRRALAEGQARDRGARVRRPAGERVRGRGFPGGLGGGLGACARSAAGDGGDDVPADVHHRVRGGADRCVAQPAVVGDRRAARGAVSVAGADGRASGAASARPGRRVARPFTRRGPRDDADASAGAARSARPDPARARAGRRRRCGPHERDGRGGERGVRPRRVDGEPHLQRDAADDRSATLGSPAPRWRDRTCSCR